MSIINVDEITGMSCPLSSSRLVEGHLVIFFSVFGLHRMVAFTKATPEIYLLSLYNGI
jgi:hypothetical protein